MRTLISKHPAIVEAVLTHDQDNDPIIVIKTTAIPFPDEPGFNQAVRDAVEEEWFSLIKENRCVGGKLLTMRR